VPDPSAIGLVEYGQRRGIFCVLDTFASAGVKATMIVSGIMVERHPEDPVPNVAGRPTTS
jgi:hypothetical protein